MVRTFLLSLLAPLMLAGCATLPPSAPPTRAAAVVGGAAAANDPRVGAIGEAVMRKGGNATDAAVAMLFAISVLEPQSTGLGGGGFYVRGAPNGTVETIDGREAAPAAAGPDWFLDESGKPIDRGKAVRSGLSIGVPGNVALAGEMHRRHGSLPWADLVAPAIALARDGFPVTPRLSGSLASYPDRAARDAGGKAQYYRPDGRAPGAGETVRYPELAKTLAMIARSGPRSFYTGKFAEGMATKVAADTPGAAKMTTSDIAGYEAKVRPPACVVYRLYRACTMGPPSSGGYAVLAILKQLEPFDLAALGLKDVRTWHLFVEAQRLAYADRERYFGDPAYVEVPLNGLLDPAYLASRSALIDPARAMKQALPGNPAGAVALAGPEPAPEHGTTHFVAVDGRGEMVSLTTTVEGAFGSGLFFGGFFLNNELTDFSFAPDKAGVPVANRVEGGKRPASSMSPVVIYDPQGRPWLSIGAAGGSLIPAQTARAIVALIDFRLPLRDALGLPFVMAVGGDTLLVEKGSWMEALGPQFLALGHAKVMPYDGLLRTTGAVRTDTGWQAAFDPHLDTLVRIPDVPQEAPSVEAGYAEGQ